MTQHRRRKLASPMARTRMKVPVTTLASYLAHVEGEVLPAVFVDDGLIIVKNFAPYVFSGKDAAAQWDASLARNTARERKFSFRPAHDFERTGDRVLFVLPTTQRGIYKDRRFEEHGAWSFVPKNATGEWRILAYGWAAIDLQDWPAKTQQVAHEFSAPDYAVTGEVRSSTRIEIVSMPGLRAFGERGQSRRFHQRGYQQYYTAVESLRQKISVRK